jgi:hypothetical protein
MKSRGLAVVAAIVLIALAVFIRSLLVGDDRGTGSDGPSKPPSGSAPVVACTPDLIAVCDALAADGLIAPDPPELDLDEAALPPDDVEGWITWNPAPAIANFDADPPAWGPVEPLGAASLAALARSEVFGGMSSDCGQEVDWACFATDGPNWGLTFGVGEPTTAEGISRLSVLALGLSPDMDTAELTSTDLRSIVESSTNGQASAAAMSLDATRPGDQHFVVGPADLLQRRADSQQGRAQQLDVQVLEPEVEAVVVLAPRSGADLGDLAEACEDDGVADALDEVGVDPCEGEPSDDLAGFLYDVRGKAS